MAYVHVLQAPFRGREGGGTILVGVYKAHDGLGAVGGVAEHVVVPSVAIVVPAFEACVAIAVSTGVVIVML